MAAKNLGSDFSRVIDAVMPKGQVIEIPKDLVDDLALRNPRFESPSSIRNYLACPLKWYFERYAPTDGDTDPPGYAGVIGSFVHRVLEVFFSEPAEMRTVELLERIFREAMDVIKQGNSRSGLIDQGLQAEFDYVKETMPKSAEEGGWGFDDMTPDRVVGAFFKKSRISLDNAKLFYKEPEHVNVERVESWARVVVNGIIIRMKIDRIDNDPAGATIVDYKTGKAPESEDFLVDEDGEPILDDMGNKILLLSDSFLAMGIYALAVSTGGVDGLDPMMPRRVQLDYLKECIQDRAKVTPHHLDLVKKMLERVTQEMLDINDTGKILASPESEEDEETSEMVPSGVCYWCQIKSVCPARDGRDGDWTELREAWEF